MNKNYHIEITRRALADHFSENALETIVNANIKQDRLAYMFGHDYIHFDGNAFERGFRYISDQEKILYENIEQSQFVNAWKAFGRLIHSWQDFYSHSNYVKLWLRYRKDHPPEAIVANDPNIIAHQGLESGKNYGVIEFVSMIPVISILIKPLMPSDSHAKMNLDSPTASPLFEYAYWAALKATLVAYEKVEQHLLDMAASENLVNGWKDQ